MISEETILGAIEACSGAGAKTLAPEFVQWALERALLWERMKKLGGVWDEEGQWKVEGGETARDPERAVSRGWKRRKCGGPLFEGGSEQVVPDVPTSGSSSYEEERMHEDR